MSNEVDDDEAFLYGSEDEGDTQVAKKPKLEKDEDSKDRKESSAENADQGEGDDDEESEDDDEEDDDEEDDSDSDIEFIIGSEEPKTTTATTQDAQQQPSGTSAVPSTAGVTVPEALDEITDSTQTEAPITETTTTEATITRIPGIDINKVGEFEGKPITSINLQDLKEKPWRQPGADISEYFNFGFDEFTWTAYCSKQDKLRSDFNPQKMMMSMMPMGLPPMMMGMPGFQMPPGGVPGGVPGQVPSLPQQPLQQGGAPQNPAQGLPTGPGQGIPPPLNSQEEKSMPLNPNLPRAPRERSTDPRDRMERENSWGGQNDNYRDRERRTRNRR